MEGVQRGGRRGPAVEDVDAQRASYRPDGLLRLLRDLEQLAGVREERVPVDTQLGAARGSDEQPYAEIPLQRRDALGHRLLRDAQLIGGGLELTGVRRDHERPHGLEVHTDTVGGQPEVVRRGRTVVCAPVGAVAWVVAMELSFRERVVRAIGVTERLNQLPYDDQPAILAAWSELIGQPVDETFHLIPPVYSDHGINLRVGRDVFVNQGCRFNDIGGIEIGDQVMFGPDVSLISSGHPVAPAERRKGITAAPIRIGSNVWIGASAMILQGVTIGDDSVIGAGAVVTHDVPAGVLAVGSPARVVRSIR